MRSNIERYGGAGKGVLKRTRDAHAKCEREEQQNKGRLYDTQP